MQWKEFLGLLLSVAPNLAEGLRPPPPPQAVERLEAELSQPLPESVRRLLVQHDGQQVGGRLLFGLVLMRLDAIFKYMQQHQPSPVELPDESSDPRLQERPSDQRFLPLFTDDTGNYLGVDLNPPPDGTPFQVVVFGADVDDPRVVAPDLDTLFSELAGEIRRGNFEVREEDGFPVMRLRQSSGTALADLLP
ncbi:SMI1/KNR4 family protein [Deinococcus murrayi]|uniref:SMI1/KNR4 family protein n=1 Tax=Deinococcus murrayi TaxID=68910 RepID=UPI000A079513|nr:SMI1/KNR4 family protein [Deinococcus murrayi]